MRSVKDSGILCFSVYQGPPRVNKGRVNTGPSMEDLLVIGGRYSGRFGGEGNFLGEKNWILQLGKGCQDPSVRPPPPRTPSATMTFWDLGIFPDVRLGY